MITGLRPYADMVETAESLLPFIPAHWEFLRSGSIFREEVQTGHPALELLSIKSGVGIVTQSSTGRKVRASEDRSQYKRIQPGWLGYNVMNAFFGGIGVSSFEGILSPAYAVASPKFDICGRFYHYLYQSPVYLTQFNREAYGIMYERNRLYFDRFRMVRAPVPPLEEQRLIVRFLDWHGGMTARLIRAKKRLVALLNEQKQAIIHHAVTRGLDPNAPMKPSGVDWLGDVPEGWEVKRLKWVAHNVVHQADNCPNDQIYVALEDIESWSGLLVRTGHSEIKGAQLKKFLPNDVLFGKLRPYLAKVIRPQLSGVCVGEILVLRANPTAIDTAYLEIRLRAFDFISHVNQSTFGAKMPRADWGFIGGTPIAYPSSIFEQAAILEYVHSATLEMNDLLSRIRCEITLIQEFRTRLIADVVTGQLDVRALAATLPAVTAAAPPGEPDDDAFDEDADALEDEEAEA